MHTRRIEHGLTHGLSSQAKRHAPGSFARRGLLLLACAGGASLASAQTLTRIAPIPAQWKLWGSCFLDAQKGFVCGEMMSLYKTLDGGSTWSRIALPGFPNEPLYDVTFLDANVGIVCGNSTTLGPDVYRTVDGGNTWARVTAFPLGGSWYHQDYVSPTTGFMGSNGAIVRTTDAGATWSLRSGYPACPNMTGMDFLDANVGFASGGLPTFVTGLFKTVDGGVTWQHKLAGAANDVIYLSAAQLVAVVDDGIQGSADGGDTWTVLHPAIATGLVDIEQVSGPTIAGVSGSGDIWRTTDGGSTWVRVWVGEGDLPGSWSVNFSDAQNGTVVGVRGLAYATQDGGQTWSRLNRGAAFEGNGIAALDDDTIVTVGHHGFAQRLTLGGAWNLALVDPPTFGRDTSYSAVSAVGSAFVYAAGHWGGLARSLDGGLNWQDLTGAVSPYFSANDVLFTDASNGWMTGWDYTPGGGSETYRTTDGGLSWQVAANGNFPGIAVDAIGSNVWIQSAAQTQWRSTDGGSTFVARQLPSNSGSAPSVSDMSFASADVGYVCGYDGYLARTGDGGLSWTPIGSTQPNTHILGVLARGTEVWICGAASGGGNAFVRRSLDGGATWTSWNPVGQYTTPYEMARADTRLYVSGYNGEIWMIDGLPGSVPAGIPFCFGDGSGTACPCGNASPSGAQSGCANSVGTGGRLTATGRAAISADTVVLHGGQMTNSSALYMQGTSQLSGGAGIVFGDGLRCAGGSIVRLGATSNVAGASAYPSTGQPPVSVRGIVTAAGDRTYQIWYRNAAAFCTPSTFNLTNAVAISWGP